jgi:hypothetical protein
MEDIMLQRYDISMDGEANRLLIKEFAVLGQKTRKREYFEPTSEKYLFIHKVTYDGDIIRAAISEGKEALISELRSDEFFPIRSCVEIIVERVIELFKDNSDSFSEVIFDDQSLLSKNVE